MAELDNRTDTSGLSDASASWPPDQSTEGPITGAPNIHFVPVDGERLEHLATERRGPLRWAATLVLTVQAEVGGNHAPTPDPEMTDVEPTRGEPTGREHTAEAESEAAAEAEAGPSPAVDSTVIEEPIAAQAASILPPATAPTGVTTPEPMPGSGWAWTAADEKSWDVWEAEAAGDADRLTTLGVELERPLPAAIRLAQGLGRRRRRVSGKVRRGVGRQPNGRTDKRSPDADGA